MAFTVLFDPARRVLLVRFGTALTQAALEDMQAAVRRFVAAHGACPGIIDLSAVERTDVSSAFLAGLARQGAVLRGQKRILVAPQDEIFGLSRMFGTHQAATGEEPSIVRSLEQAYAVLGLDAPDWQPVDPG